VASWSSSFREGEGEGGGAIAYPDAPKRWLPKDPGQGLERFRNFVSAASGRPASRAIRFIDEFTSMEAGGYVLTHQFLVIAWAADVGLELPERVRARAPGLLAKILAEHRSDASPSDLDFERSMILLVYTEPSEEEARAWIDRMLDAWDPRQDRWTFEHRATIDFDGHSYGIRFSGPHPTAMALGAVKIYLDRFAGAGREGSAGRWQSIPRADERAETSTREGIRS